MVTDADYARAVGERLRQVRQRLRLSLQAVERMSSKEFKASVVGAYERGEREISVSRLQRLAAVYDVPVDALLPATALARAARGGGTGDGDLDARIETIAARDPDILERYLRMVRARRRNPEGGPIAIREEDVRAMELLLGPAPTSDAD